MIPENDKKHKLKIYFILRLIYIVPFIIVPGILLHTYLLKKNILTLPNKNFYYNDRDTVKSSIAIDSTNNFKVSYKLAGSRNPFAGITFFLDTSSQKSFKQFDIVSIIIDSPNEKIIPVIFGENIDAYNKSGLPIHHRYWTYDLNVKKGTHQYDLPLNSFKVFFWWFRDYDIQIGNLPDYNPNKVYYIAIQSNRLQKAGDSDYFYIISFYLKKTFNFYWFILPVSLLILIESLLSMEKHFTKTIEFQPVIINQKKQNDEWSIIKEVIGKNYHLEELKLEYVQNSTGIQKSKISQLIKLNSDLSFKQYLNEIRIHEATRLLSTTNLNISEIAYRVGFSNISHFNRVFKELKSCSPSDFRKNTTN